MKTMLSLGLVLSMIFTLAACAMAYDEDYEDVGQDEAALSSLGESEMSADKSDGPSTEATGSCTVSVECANGSTKSCSGSNGSCAAAVVGGVPRVTCNGNSWGCPIEDCSFDGVCNGSCSFDPDCGGICRPNTFCFDDSQCGFDGACDEWINRCICF